jgi:cobalt-zinc-cadmium efflux system membrane fusion protein
MRPITASLLPVLCAVGTGCRDAPAPAPPAPESGAGDQQAMTNRIDVPPAVRQNLGITFVEVQRRAVERPLRAPGRFELLPRARREYHAPLDGRVELLVEQYQRIEAGQPLYRLDSPGWRRLQREIAEAQGAVRRAEAEQASIAPLLDAHREHMESLHASVELWSGRVEQLDQIRAAGGGRAGDWAQAQASVTQSRAELAGVNEQTVELEARRSQVIAELEATRARLDLLMASAATLLGVDVEQLEASGEGEPPLWRTVSTIEIEAAAPGVVEDVLVSSGAWIDERALILRTVQLSLVRFRARGLQSDLPRLREGLPARIIPPTGGPLGPAEAMVGPLTLGITADADHRSIDLVITPQQVAAWARPGVSGFLEVQLDGDAREELAIPLGAVVRDGLTPVIFRRDPDNPNQVIRLEADLGLDDGRWVQVRSGLRDGDEVVVDGAYQLMLASSGSIQSGGHFHADGTFHEGDH